LAPLSGTAWKPSPSFSGSCFLSGAPFGVVVDSEEVEVEFVPLMAATEAGTVDVGMGAGVDRGASLKVGR
jgi:hypothetical protein